MMRGRIRRNGALMTALVAIASLAALGPAGAAAAQSVRSAPAIQQSDCFQRFDLFATDHFAFGGIGTDGDLYFVAGSRIIVGPPGFCQARTTANGKIVEIFITDGSNRCLALNSTTGAIYLHSAAGCTSDTATYTQWRFMAVGRTDTANGNLPIYALQNQYAVLGKPCLYDNIQADPAIYNSCAPYKTNTFEWFDYQLLPN